jgi:hypothetical protein
VRKPFNPLFASNPALCFQYTVMALRGQKYGCQVGYEDPVAENIVAEYDNRTS